MLARGTSVPGRTSENATGQRKRGTESCKKEESRKSCRDIGHTVRGRSRSQRTAPGDLRERPPSARRCSQPNLPPGAGAATRTPSVSTGTGPRKWYITVRSDSTGLFGRYARPTRQILSPRTSPKRSVTRCAPRRTFHFPERPILERSLAAGMRMTSAPVQSMCRFRRGVPPLRLQASSHAYTSSTGRSA